MFSTDAQTAIDRAKDVGFTRGDKELTLRAIATALVMDGQASAMLAEALSTQEAVLQQHFKPPESVKQCQAKMPLAENVREMLAAAKALVQAAPSRRDSGLIAVPHLVCATALVLPTGELPSGARL